MAVQREVAGLEDFFDLAGDSEPQQGQDLEELVQIADIPESAGEPSRAALLEEFFDCDIADEDGASAQRRDVSALEDLFDLTAVKTRSHPSPMPQSLSERASTAAKARWRCSEKQEPQESATEVAYGKLADAWDLMPLRHGDLAARPAEDARTWSHGNTFNIRQYTRLAFCEVGKGERLDKGEVTFNATRRKIECLAHVAVLGQLALQRASRKVFSMFASSDHVKDMEGCVYVRSSDATPMAFKFGKLQDQLASIARYLKYIEPEDPANGYGRWTTISYAQYIKEHPGKVVIPFGVLEVLGASADVHWCGFKHRGEMSQECRESFWRKRHEFTFAPQLLERNNSSTLFSCLESLSDPFDITGIKEIESKMENIDGVVIVADMMDNCRVTRRCVKATASKYADNPRILFVEATGCEAHILHGTITHEMREDQIVGNTHAFALVTGITQRRQQLIDAASSLLEEELYVHPGAPPPEHNDDMDKLVENTFSRQGRVVRGSVSSRAGDDKTEESGTRALEQALPGFRKIVNGKLTKGRCEHHCNGCCINPLTGRADRETAVKNYLAALLSVGIFGGVGMSTPAMSRWLSTSAVLAVITAGVLVHGILPRAWQRAFGKDWAIPAGKPLDDYHKVVRSARNAF